MLVKMKDPFNNVGRMCSITDKFINDMLSDMNMPSGRNREWVVMEYAGGGCWSWCPSTCSELHPRYLVSHVSGDYTKFVVHMSMMTNLY